MAEADGWTCGVCNAVEGWRMEGTNEQARVDAVCHHCGKLLCRTHQQARIDEVFSQVGRAGQTEAMHCIDCQALPGHRVP
jgi:hypothetical protein